MASKVGICNLALGFLGRSAVTSVTEVERLDDTYEQARRELLEAHPWNFAIRRVSLGRSTTTPAFNFDYQYVLPADFIRLIYISNDEDNTHLGDPYYNGYKTFSLSNLYHRGSSYRIEDSANDGKVLLSNEDVSRIVYVFDLQDSNKFSPSFTTTLAYSIASKMAYNLTKKASLAQELTKLYVNMLSQAQSIDGQQSQINRTERGVFYSSRY